MPGRDYPHAFALLEQSLGDENLYMRSSPIPTSDLDNLVSYDYEQTPGTPVLAANGTSFNKKHFLQQDSSFPPTPPPSNPTQIIAPLGLRYGRSENYRSDESGFTTPTNPQSLPTPETTPPRHREFLTQKASNHLTIPSPYTESFQTAREEQDEVEIDELPHLPKPYVNTTEGLKMTAGLRGLGVKVLTDSAKKTPHLRHKPEFFSVHGTIDTRNSHGNDSETSIEAESSEDEDLLVHEEIDESMNTGDSIPILMRGLSLRDGYASKQHSRQTSKDAPASSELSPLSDDASIFHNVYDLDLKRLSGTSGSSTVVEAVVIDRTPPPRKRKLRHVSKTESLRDESSPQLLSSSPIFIDSLSQIRSPMEKIWDSQHRYSNDSQNSSPTLPRSLRRRPEIIPPRPLTAPEEQNSLEDMTSARDSRRVVSDPLRISTSLIEDTTPPPPSASPASVVADEFLDASSTVPLDENPPTLDRNSLDNKREAPRFYHDLYPEHSTSGQEPESPESARRVSFAPSLPWSDYSRQFHGASPSETVEHIEINEAAAVKFSSHTNNSLLMVNYTNSQENVPRHPGLRDTLEQENAKQTPLITVEPSNFENHVRPQDEVWFATDSPLQNPRAPPKPPVVAIIPPTPARELDSQDNNENNYTSRNQQMSILGRARRYSESVVQPLAETFRRSLYSSSGIRSRSATRDEQVEHLHPDWQPKGYWAEDNGNNPDTTDVQTYDQPNGRGAPETPEKWRRMGSLRGFLIGNTLGIQRGPTNKRRHVVSLPENRRRRQNKPRYGGPIRHVSVRDSVKRSGSTKKYKRHSGATNFFRSWQDKVLERRREKQSRLQHVNATRMKANIGWPSTAEDTSVAHPNNFSGRTDTSRVGQNF